MVSSLAIWRLAHDRPAQPFDLLVLVRPDLGSSHTRWLPILKCWIHFNIADTPIVSSLYASYGRRPLQAPNRLIAEF